ncbi:MAG: hypothetical protein K2Y21_02965 [Phycisphaerales bacterium]|nr:hypothetical protein [Phycisphaerales bacterium]
MRIAGVWLALVAGLAVAIGSIGGPHGAVQALAALLWWMFTAGWPVVVYFASSYGLGLIVRRIVRGGGGFQAPLTLCVGLSVQLTIGHAINCFGGVLPGLAWNVAALVPAVVGLVVGIAELRRVVSERGVAAEESRSYSILVLAGLATAIAAAVMVVAACQPPGILWASEFGGFDALSYHLQLPQEWLAAGRLAPVTHNVYSFLPSYLESAFLTLQLWAFVPRTSGDGVAGMLSGEGALALSCQMLHVGCALAAAWVSAAAARAACARVVGEEGTLAGRVGGLVAGVFAVGLPWAVVTGSLAYNEMGVNALFAAAMLVALEARMSAMTKGVLAGWLVGVACGVKPTALFFAAPPVGLVLIAASPRDAVRVIGGALVGGAAAIAPWLLRNYIACGNPVFPALHAVFGEAHWTAEQFARFAGAHRFDGSWVERLKLLVLADPNDPAGLRHRGLMHSQWSVFPFVAGAAMLVCGMFAARRGGDGRGRLVIAALLVGIVVQVFAWLAFTHLQSRFLLPLAVPGAVVIGLGVAVLSRRSVAAARLVGSAALVIGLFQSIRALDHFWSERGGQPNVGLMVGPQGLVQRDLRDEKRSDAFRPGEVVYLLGDSTPLYVPGPVVYHTTWDTLRANSGGDAIAELENELRRRGVTGILVNPMELNRLSKTGWYDPAVTPESVRAWAERSMRTVRVLETGQVLLRWKDVEAAR